MASLWLMAALAPCVMAQSQEMDYSARYTMIKTMAQSPMQDCGPMTAVSCQLPDFNSPLSLGLGDFGITPILLNTLPVTLILPQTTLPTQKNFYNPDILAPPLHIRHLTLIL